MRTTLDLDPKVLAAARASVNAGQHKSIGQAVSALALKGLDEGAVDLAWDTDGLIMLPTRAGHAVTDEAVAEALLDE